MQNEKPKSAAAGGFVGGFFGCFGVAAAIVAVLIAMAIVGKWQVAERPESEREDELNTAANADHCLNGLAEAQARGLVSSDRSALSFPWHIRGDPAVAGRLICQISDRDEIRDAAVDVRCADPDAANCSSLVSVTPRPFREGGD